MSENNNEVMTEEVTEVVENDEVETAVTEEATEATAETEELAPPVMEEGAQIFREIDYFVSYYKELIPRVVISYEREAFYSKTDSTFRITFDKNVLYRQNDLSLESGVYGKCILPKGKVLMEVKTAYAIPLWLASFLSENKIYKTSYSKYGTAYADILSENKKEINNYVGQNI